MNLFSLLLGPSWKTTAMGIVAAIGVAFYQSPDPWLHGIGLAFQIFGVAGMGTAAKDHDVTHNLSTGSADNITKSLAAVINALPAVQLPAEPTDDKPHLVS